MPLFAVLLLYLVVLLALGRLLGRRYGADTAKAFALACSLATAAYIAGFFLFEALVAHYRSPGGPERQGSSREAFLLWAEVGLFALYGIVLAVSAALGYGLGRRLARRGGLVAVATSAAVAGLLAATFPAVEFANACTAGEPLVLDRYIACG